MNICFDECLPPKWFRHLSGLLQKRKVSVGASHLLDHFQQGTKDDAVADWLARQSPAMMIVSGDSGIHTKQGQPRLHLLCPARKLTSVFVARKLCQSEGFEKLRMMMVCLPQLQRAYDAQAGLRYRLELSRDRHHDYYQIREWA